MARGWALQAQGTGVFTRLPSTEQCWRMAQESAAAGMSVETENAKGPQAELRG